MAALLVAAGAAHGATMAWKLQPSPNNGSTDNELDAVAATSPSNAWAVGEYITGSGVGVFRTLVEHWNGSAWQIQPSPNTGSSDNDLFAVAGTSATNAWAVGYYFNGNAYQTLIEHWNGTAWKVQASPNPSPLYDQLSAVVAFSATNAWAIGEDYSGGTPGTLVEHWNGTTWQVQASANSGASANDLYGLAATSATNMWAAGEFLDGSGGYQTLIEQYNGTAWQVQPSPSPGGASNDNFLAGVAAPSATNAWTVGYYFNGSKFATLVEQWSGTAWQVQPSPNLSSSDNELTAVAASSAINAWTVGDYYDGNANQTLIEQWNGTAWQIQPSPNPGGRGSGNYLFGVAATSATNAWAVGYYFNGTAQRTLIEQTSGTG